jgi:hypothetical protein
MFTLCHRSVEARCIRIPFQIQFLSSSCLDVEIVKELKQTKMQSLRFNCIYSTKIKKCNV